MEGGKRVGPKRRGLKGEKQVVLIRLETGREANS